MEAIATSCLSHCRISGWRAQFGNPTGWLGSLVGHLMAATNKDRSQWVLSLLDLQPQDRVLEVGFGSGMDILRVSRIVKDGLVAGIDHSEVMLRQAARRNAAALRSGRVELRQSAMPQVPYPDGSFDKAFSINAVQFWPDVVEGLRELRRVLRPGGLVATALQPRHRGASKADADRAGRELRLALDAAGFEEVRVEIFPSRPAPTVCVLGWAAALSGSPR